MCKRIQVGLCKIIIQYKIGQRAITYTQTKGVKCRSGQVHVGSLLQLKMWYEQLMAILLKWSKKVIEVMKTWATSMYDLVLENGRLCRAFPGIRNRIRLRLAPRHP